MSKPVADDFAEIARRVAELAAEKASVNLPPPACPECRGVGWVAVYPTVAPERTYHACLLCYNPMDRPVPAA